MRKVSYPKTVVLVAALLCAGLLLRVYFVRWHAFIAGDSLLYQDIAQNWLHAHVYGLSTDGAPRPTLIRLPGYPAILALLSLLVDRFAATDPGTLRSFLPELSLQVLVDLLTCCLLAALARRLFGARAGLVALALSCLCPFLANYTAVPLTETFTIFTTALAYWAVQRWRDRRHWPMLVSVAAALSGSILLRPDQALLALAVWPLLLMPVSNPRRRVLAPLLACIALVATPFVPWTIRNAHTFGVFQPLAPRLANDPGEAVPRGFQRWYRTFAVDFASTEDAYWKYPEEPVVLSDLPARSFDSVEQKQRTADLLHQAAAYSHLDARVDAGFAELAAVRIRAQPVRYYLLLPVARLVNMLFQPRRELLALAERGWQFREHPGQTTFAALFGLLGVAYIVLALRGLPVALQAAPALCWSLCSFVLLRCALLVTLDNAEQRYTLEFFPVWILLGSACFATKRET